MEMKDFILSPQEKRVLEPFLKYFAPEYSQGKKELVINKPRRVGFEDFSGEWSFFDAPELDSQTLMTITRLMADLNRLKFSIANPNISMRLPGGHRAQVVGGNQIESQFSMTVRLHQEREFALESYQMSDADRAAVVEAVATRKTILISGGTGSGKTSFMNALIQHIPLTERLVTLEDVRELKVPHENWCGLIFSNTREGDGSQADNILALLNATLRMRPDRILLGEIRKENAFTFASAINTGHSGSMATIHANNPRSALDAVINRAMLNGDMVETGINIMRQQLKTDVYGVIQLERVSGGVKGYFEVLQKD